MDIIWVVVFFLNPCMGYSLVPTSWLLTSPQKPSELKITTLTERLNSYSLNPDNPTVLHSSLWKGGEVGAGHILMLMQLDAGGCEYLT